MSKVVAFVAAVLIPFAAFGIDLPSILPGLPDMSDMNLEEVFNFLDKDSDGAISLKELKGLTQGLTPEVFAIIDPDGSGGVTQEELMGLSPVTMVDFVLAVFDLIDKNDDLMIQKEELKSFSLIASMFFSEVDINADGVLSFADAITYLASPEEAALYQTLVDLYLTMDTELDGCIPYEKALLVIAGLSEAFYALADKDGDGTFCYDDALLMSEGDIPALVDALFDDADTDGDEALSLPEAQAFIPAITEEMFGYLDQNGDGVLSEDDLGDITPPPPDDPIQALIDFFMELDADASGCWTHDELLAGMPGLPDSLWTYMDQLECGAAMRPGTDGLFCLNDVMCISDYGAVAAQVLAAADKDGDGLVTLEEAQALVPALTADLFDLLDADGDGALTGDDFDVVMPPPPPNPLGKIVAFFNGLDADTDGCWTYPELQAGIPELPQAVFDYIDIIECNGTIAFEDTADGKVCPADLACIDERIAPELAELLLPVFDANEDGYVTEDELAAVVPEIAEPLLLLLDSNWDGKLSMDDFSWTPPPLDPLEEIMVFFMGLDVNLNGCWTYEELQAGLPGLTAGFFDYLDRQSCNPTFMENAPDGAFCVGDVSCLLYGERMHNLVKVFVKAADTDGDATVDEDEMAAFAPEIADALMTLLDMDGDGGLSNEDFGMPPADPFQFFFDMLDEHGGDDGCLTFDDFAAAIPGATDALFRALDANGDDTVCKPELMHLAPISWRHAGLEVIAIADTDGDDALTLAEAQAFVPGLPVHLFKAADTNGDGVISEADLPDDPAQEWPTPPVTKPAALLTWLLRFADANGDGAVTQEEAAAAVPELPAGIFTEIDDDDDGVLTVDDVIPETPDAPENLLLHLLQHADADANGEVTLAEARDVVPNLPEEAFARLDANGDGVLSSADVVNEPPAGARERLLRLLRQADGNNDGMVTLPEFLSARPELDEADFAKLDANGDGVLTRADAPDAELEALQVLLQFLSEADANGDGVVTFEELTAVRPGMTPQQYAGFDFNGDGVLSRDDLPAVEEDPLGRLTQLLFKADANGDRVVTFEELQAVAPDVTQEQYNKLDRNADGVITPEDLPDAPADPRDALLALIRGADANRDGVVTEEEFAAAAQAGFERYDTNGDGVIDAADMPTGPVPDSEDLRHALLRNLIRADRNGNGVLDYAEIAFAFPDAPAEFLALIDTDHSWSISRPELVAALALDDAGHPVFAGEDQDCDGAFTAADIQLVINHALRRAVNVLFSDVDGNGKVDAVDVQRVILKVLRG